MVLQLISLGRSKQPLLNEFSQGVFFESQMKSITDTLYKRIRQTPELLAMLDTVVSDHYLGPVDFFDPDGNPLGPTKLKQVRKFWSAEKVQSEAFRGQGFDFFVDGSSFGWHVNAMIKLKELGRSIPYMVTKLKGLDLSLGRFAEEQSKMPRKVSYLAASTMTIKHDENGIVFYVQEAGGKKVRWDVDQVVHIKQEFNGEVRGMSPLKALTKEIVMMFMLKENILAQLQNGGSMDNIISLVNANGSSKGRFERLRTAIESFGHLRKSHGNMPIDADVKVHPIGMSLKDMEYKELAMFAISEFALCLNLPISRVPFMMTGSGGSSSKGELSGTSEDAYQSLINTKRKAWEDGWNPVFRQGGFTFKFRRTNLQDDVRETMALGQNAAYVISVQESLMKAGLQLTEDSHLAMLSGKKKDLNSGDVKELDKSVLDMLSPNQPPNSPAAGQGGSSQPSNKSSEGRVARDVSASKSRTASNNGVSA